MGMGIQNPAAAKRAKAAVKAGAKARRKNSEADIRCTDGS
jgi:hypothetical protein